MVGTWIQIKVLFFGHLVTGDKRERRREMEDTQQGARRWNWTCRCCRRTQSSSIRWATRRLQTNIYSLILIIHLQHRLGVIRTLHHQTQNSVPKGRGEGAKTHEGSSGYPNTGYRADREGDDHHCHSFTVQERLKRCIHVQFKPGHTPWQKQEHPGKGRAMSCTQQGMHRHEGRKKTTTKRFTSAWHNTRPNSRCWRLNERSNVQELHHQLETKRAFRMKEPQAIPFAFDCREIWIGSWLVKSIYPP